jgi:hypothetical protein
MRSIIIWTLFLVLLLFTFHDAFGQKKRNLVVNGDFSSGSMNFDSDYDYKEKELSEAQTYSIAFTPKEVHPNFASFKDHTDGRGKMLVVNGGNREYSLIWRQKVVVEKGNPYLFEFYAASAYPDNPAVLALFINGVEQAAVKLTPETGKWQRAYEFWESGESIEAVLEIRLKTTAYVGNDFAIDDIFFSAD